MIRTLLCSVLAASALAAAQQPGKGDLTVRFLAERAPGNVEQVLLAAGEVKGKPFTLPVNNLSEAQSAPARVFSIRPVGKDIPLATVTLPAEGKAFNVLLVPSAKGGYEPVVIPAGDPSFKPGDVYFYNHSDKTVLGFVGKATFTLAPSQGRILRPEGARDDGHYDVGFGVREKEGDRTLSKSRWPVDTTSRSYAFFFMNPKTKRVDFRVVDEFVPVEKPNP
jgi:hypothetical protein